MRRSSLREMQQLARPGASTVAQGRRGRPAAAVRRLRVRALHHRQLRLRAHRGAQRRPARFRIADALAPRVWSRHHRVRQSHLHRLGSPDRRGVRRRCWGRPAPSRPRMAVPAPALVDARAKVTQLVMKWDDALAKSLAAENSSSTLARSIGVRRILPPFGPRWAPALRAAGLLSWRMRFAESGSCPASAEICWSRSLSPRSRPPKVQFLEVTPAPPPEEVGRPALCQGS